jgi:molybdate transport system substrate-binding protein
VVVVPKANPARIRTVYNLAKSGVKLVVAGPGVPVGSYTLQILKNMNLSAPVLKNVVSRETDVREVLAKVALGEADAGFVYSTDAKTVSGKVTVIRVPAWAQPKVQYGMCIVSKSSDKADAQAFIKKVLSKAGQARMLQYGFLPRVKAVPKKKR